MLGFEWLRQQKNGPRYHWPHAALDEPDPASGSGLPGTVATADARFIVLQFRLGAHRLRTLQEKRKMKNLGFLTARFRDGLLFPD